MSLAIGIDLGTTNTVCAVWRDGRAEVVPSSGGARLTPSVVAYGAGAGGAPLVGQPAVDQAALNAENTIYDVKRLMGRRWEDPDVQRDASGGRWPFQVVESEGRACVSVEISGQRRSVLPEQVSAAVLAHVRDSAEAHLGWAVRDAVVTVPAYFSDAQRNATKDACAVAGLRALRIINEPTAAALAYGLAEQNEDERLVLVYDWGGGTLDVSLLSIEEGVFEVRSTAGDTRLGGTDLDAALAKHLAEEFQKRTGQDPLEQPKALRRLLTAAEKAKCALSEALETRIELDALMDGEPLQATVTRATFERLSEPFLERALAPISMALRDADLAADDVHELLLVGGSTRIPELRSRLQAMFPGRELRQVVSPDEAVALGAAAQAALLSGDRSETITDLVLVDVTPLSLGISALGEDVLIQIYEGERAMTRDNNLLGKFYLNGLPAAPRGKSKVDVTFEIDENGILNVSAVEQTTNKSNKITITNDRGRLSKTEINRLIEESKQFAEADKMAKEKAHARNELEHYCFKLKGRCEDKKFKGIDPVDRLTVLTKCNETVKWMDSNVNATKQDCLEKLEELKHTCDIIMAQFLN